MTEKQKISILNKVDEMGWYFSVNEDDGSIEFEKYSPAGEDFIFSIEGKDIIKEIKDYADDFDPDEHAKMWVENMDRVRGVPKNIRTLIDDAEAIDDMLREPAEALLDMEA